MRTLTFAKRNAKELLRDPLNLCFLFGFPAVLLILLSIIQANIPVNLFEIKHLAPGVAVFGLSFMTLFSATIISKDRKSSFMQRLYTTPIRPVDFILGYTLPLIPIAMVEGIFTYAIAIIFKLEINAYTLISIVFIIPVAMFYIGLGLLCGSIFNDKQVGGICGALLTNVSAWLAGIWFDLELVGGVFKRIAYALPFVHSVEMQRAIIRGDMAGIFPHLWWVLGYAIAINIIAVFVFLRQMKKQ